MKILHILDHYKPHFSGYVFRSNYILHNQKKMGIEPVVLTSPKQGEVRESVEFFDGIKIYRTLLSERHFGSIPFLKEAKLMNTLAKRIREIVSEIKPDIIHAHSPSLNGIPAQRVAEKMGLPVVYEVRAFWEDAAVDHETFKENSFKYKLSRLIETRLFKNVDAIFTICGGMKSEIVNRGVPESKITVIPNGVDTKKFSFMGRDKDLVKQLKINGRNVIGFIGSFYHYEGIDLLIDAFARILREDNDVILLLVGEGPEYMRMREKTDKMSLNGYVTFTGKIPHQEIKRYYSLMDILVYPRKSIRLTELVTPLKPLEAMAMGKVVVGSDVGGMKELIRDGHNGVLFESDRVESLVKKLLGLISNPGLREGLSREAVMYVRKERNWDNIIHRYIPVYERVLKTKN